MHYLGYLIPLAAFVVIVGLAYRSFHKPVEAKAKAALAAVKDETAEVKQAAADVKKDLSE
ncbi:MAG TPA: hypothetical protein VF841_16765 [Anaeromyxobacter sp.]